MSKFRKDDWVRVIDHDRPYFDQVGQVVTVYDNAGLPHAFRVRFGDGVVKQFGESSLILADPERPTIAERNLKAIRDEMSTDLRGTKLPTADPVNNPSHYTSHPSGIECIEITRHMGFNLGNAFKYLWRADLKGNAIQDLEKAVFYIKDEIAKRKAAL